MTTRVHMSELKDCRDMAGNFASEQAEDPTKLCSNFRFGCNGISDGPDDKGFLALCDDCASAEGYLLAGRGGVTFTKRAK